MNDLVIREAQMSDAGDLAAIERACFGDGALTMLTIVQYLELFARSSLVAVRKGRCIGMLVAGASSDDPRTAWILDVAVDPSARRTGVASRLMRDASGMLNERGVRVVLATVAPANEASARLFQRYQFVIDRTEPDYFGPGEARHILRLEFPSEAGHASSSLPL